MTQNKSKKTSNKDDLYWKQLEEQHEKDLAERLTRYKKTPAFHKLKAEHEASVSNGGVL